MIGEGEAGWPHRQLYVRLEQTTGGPERTIAEHLPSVKSAGGTVGEHELYLRGKSVAGTVGDGGGAT